MTKHIEKKDIQGYIKGITNKNKIIYEDLINKKEAEPYFGNLEAIDKSRDLSTEQKSNVKNKEELISNIKSNKVSFSLSEEEPIRVVSLMNSLFNLIYMGSCVSGFISKYYDDESIDGSTLSSILKSKDKNYIRDYFSKLVSCVYSTSEDYLFWLSFCRDENELPISDQSDAKSMNFKNSFDKAIYYFDAIINLFTEVWFYKIEIPNFKDDTLIDFADKSLTVGNYLYLKFNKYRSLAE